MYAERVFPVRNLPSAVLADKSLPPGARLFYLVLTETEQPIRTDVRMDTLAARLAVSDRVLSKWLKLLQRRGFVVVTRRGGLHGANEYRFPQLEKPRDLAS